MNNLANQMFTYSLNANLYKIEYKLSLFICKTNNLHLRFIKRKGNGLNNFATKHQNILIDFIASPDHTVKKRYEMFF